MRNVICIVILKVQSYTVWLSVFSSRVSVSARLPFRDNHAAPCYAAVQHRSSVMWEIVFLEQPHKLTSWFLVGGDLEHAHAQSCWTADRDQTSTAVTLPHITWLRWERGLDPASLFMHFYVRKKLGHSITWSKWKERWLKHDAVRLSMGPGLEGGLLRTHVFVFLLLH